MWLPLGITTGNVAAYAAVACVNAAVGSVEYQYSGTVFQLKSGRWSVVVWCKAGEESPESARQKICCIMPCIS